MEYWWSIVLLFQNKIFFCRILGRNLFSSKTIIRDFFTNIIVRFLIICYSIVINIWRFTSGIRNFKKRMWMYCWCCKWLISNSSDFIKRNTLNALRLLIFYALDIIQEHINYKSFPIHQIKLYLVFTNIKFNFPFKDLYI